MQALQSKFEWHEEGAAELARAFVV
eukprot:COSAG01_NODE_49525_length_371_cov_0.988971_2_plen_24_part_01